MYKIQPVGSKGMDFSGIFVELSCQFETSTSKLTDLSVSSKLVPPSVGVNS